MTATKSNASTGSTRYLDIVSSREFKELVTDVILENRIALEKTILSLMYDNDDTVIFSRNAVHKKMLAEYDRIIMTLENKFAMSIVGEGEVDYTIEWVKENVTRDYREKKR